MSIIILALCVVAVVAGLFAVLIRRLLSRPGELESDLDWFSQFSLSTYQPMQRLLDENDYRFLAQQPGYSASIARNLRVERRRIFRSYLRALVSDFNRLVRLVNLVVVYSPDDRPDLASRVSKLRMQFYLGVLQAELSLLVGPSRLQAAGTGVLIKTVGMLEQNVRQIGITAV